MKKSVKCFLLALMVLCLSATAGFADSYDVALSIDVSAGAGKILAKPEKITGAKNNLPSVDIKQVVSNASLAMALTPLSVDISFDATLPEAERVFKLSLDITDVKLGEVRSGDSAGTVGTTNLETGIPIPADKESMSVYVELTTTSTSLFGTVVKFVVVGHQSGDVPVGGVFKSARFTLSADLGTSETITPISFDLSTKTVSRSVTLSKGLGGQVISFDISSDVKLLTATSSLTKEVVKSDDAKATVVKVTAPAAGASADVKFFFTSGDAAKNESFDVTVKLIVNASDSETGSGLDYGTIHFVATSGDTTVASFDVVSDDYKSGFVASGDSTATAISKTGTFPTTATVKITVDKGTNGTAKVYDIFSGTDSVSDDYTASTGVFDPKTVEGTYKVVFVTDDTAEKPYFAVEFKVAGSSVAPDPIDPEDVDSTKGTDTEALAPTSVTTDSDGNTVTYIPANFNLPVTLKGGVWTFTSIASKYLAIATAALDKIADSDLVAMLTDAKFAPGLTGEYTYVGAKLKKKVYPGTIFIIRLVLNASGGSVNAAAGTTIEGAMTVEGEDAKTATDELAIDTTDLRSTSNGDTVITVPAGDYNITYSSLNGEVVGGLNEAVPLAGNEDVDPIIGSNKGSSSGCDAGFGALALLALALPLVKKIKK